MSYATGLQSQLIGARTELGAKKDECRRLQAECRHLKKTVAERNARDEWRRRNTECRNESWSRQRELGQLKRELRAKATGLDALREEVRRAKFAEASHRGRARKIEGELARVRIVYAHKEAEEDAALRKAFPFISKYVRYLKDHCRKPFDMRRPYPGHCPRAGSRVHWRYYYLLCS
jgi:chromosome segregation ATPase